MGLVKSNVFVFVCVGIFSLLFFAGVYNEDLQKYQVVGDRSFDLRLVIMFLLAEPHFAITLPLLFGYRSFFLQRKLEFILLPGLIVFLAIALFYLNFLLFTLVFLLFNVYHVNRQSVGFLMIQGNFKAVEVMHYEWLLHIASSLFFVVHFKFLEYRSELSLVFILLLILVGVFFWKNKKKSWPTVSNLLVFLQGFLIFAPVAFFDNLHLAFAIGISIHFIQYLFVATSVCKRAFGFSLFLLVCFLGVYSVLTSGILGGFFTDNNRSVLVLIPTTLQLLHFYFDGFIWRRSNETVRNVLSRLA